VNHSLHFKDPESGVHTNSIEASWRAAKATFTNAGRKKAHLQGILYLQFLYFVIDFQFLIGNLSKYLFIKQCAKLGQDPTVEFFRLAGNLYDPRRPAVDVPVLEIPGDVDDIFG